MSHISGDSNYTNWVVVSILFSPRFCGEMIQFDGCIFFKWVAKNHQLAKLWWILDGFHWKKSLVHSLGCKYIVFRKGTKNSIGWSRLLPQQAWIFFDSWMGYDMGRIWVDINLTPPEILTRLFFAV